MSAWTKFRDGVENVAGDIGAAAGGAVMGPVGYVGGYLLGKKAGDAANPKPDDPTSVQPISGDDPETQLQMQRAANQMMYGSGRGMAANMLTGGAGLSTAAPVSRNILLGV
jgi:hypothetical protein